MSTSPKWFVCRVTTRQEKRILAAFEEKGITAYCPMERKWSLHARPKVAITRALFPGYVFAKIPVEQKSRIYQQDLLARAITVTDEAKFLRQLGEVKAIVASGFEFSVMPLFTKGRHVKIIGGPLYGLEGFVDDPRNPQGVVISVDVLQQGLLVKVPVEHLRVLD